MKRTLARREDRASYSAKRENAPFYFYEIGADEGDDSSLAVVGELRRALDEHELVLHYQPKAVLADGEVLEAGLIVGIVLAATEGIAGRLRWIGGGVAAGAMGAGLLALFAGDLSNSLSGQGQEYFNAVALLLALTAAERRAAPKRGGTVAQGGVDLPAQRRASRLVLGRGEHDHRQRHCDAGDGRHAGAQAHGSRNT